MTGPGDDANNMNPTLRSATNDDLPDVVAELLRDDVLLAAGYGDDKALASTLNSIRELRTGPVPEPSAELAELFGRGVPGSLGARRMSRRHKVIIGTVIAGAMSVSVSGVAAAHNQLPSGAQNVVTRVVNDLTPFSIPPERARPSSVPSVAHPTQPRAHPSGLPVNTDQPGKATPTEPAEPAETPNDQPSTGADASAPQRQESNSTPSSATAVPRASVTSASADPEDRPPGTATNGPLSPAPRHSTPAPERSESD